MLLPRVSRLFVADLNVTDTAQVTGAIYSGGPQWAEYTAMLSKAVGMFLWSNPLHFGLHPDVRQMEAEVVAMTLKAFNGGADACGNVTSGGTESILMAMKVGHGY